MCYNMPCWDGRYSFALTLQDLEVECNAFLHLNLFTEDSILKEYLHTTTQA